MLFVMKWFQWHCVVCLLQSVQTKQESLLRHVDELDTDNESLRSQVAELEDSRDQLLQQISQLTQHNDQLMQQITENKVCLTLSTDNLAVR